MATTRVVNNENRVHQFTVDGQLIMLNPGVNEIDSDLWTKAQKIDGVRRLMDADVPGLGGTSPEHQDATMRAASLNTGTPLGTAPGTAPNPAIPTSSGAMPDNAPERKKILAMAGEGDGPGSPARTMPTMTGHEPRGAHGHADANADAANRKAAEDAKAAEEAKGRHSRHG